MIVQLPDGQVVEFPEGMPEADINAAIQNFLAPPRDPTGAPPIAAPVPTPAPAAPEPSGLTIDPFNPDAALRGLQLGTQKVGSGAADIAGMPADLSTMLANLIPQGLDLGASGINKGAEFLGLENPDLGVDFRFPPSPLGSESIKNTASGLAEKVGLSTIQDDELTPTARALGEGIRFGTGALGGTTALARTAAKRGIDGGIRQLPRMSDALVRPFQSGSVRPAVGDVAAGAGSGVALSAVRDLLPEGLQGPITDALAMLLGGVGGGVTANIARSPKGAADTATNALTTDRSIPNDPATGLPTSNSTADRAAEFLQGQTSASPGQVASDVRAAALESTEAGAPLATAGIASGDIGLTAAERGARLRDPVPFQESDQALKDAAQSRVEGVRNDGDPLQATRAAEETAARTRQAAQQSVDDAEKAATAADDVGRAQGDALASNSGTGGEASKKLDEVVRETVNVEQTRSTNLFRNIDPEGAVVLEASPMSALVKDIRESVPRTVPDSEVLPEAFLRKFDEVGTPGIKAVETTDLATGKPTTVDVDAPATVTFKELNDARPFLASAIQKAREDGNFKIADNLKKLKTFVDDTVEDLAADSSEAGVRAKEALDNFKVRFAPRFREGEGGKFAKNVKDADNTKARPSETAARFLSREESAADLANILQVAKNPAEGHTAARQFLLDQASSFVDAKGKVSGDRLAKWRDNHKGVLNKVPDPEGGTLLDEVNTLVRQARQGAAKENQLAGDLKAAQTSQKLSERELQNSAAGLLLNKDPAKAVAEILSSGPNIAPRKMAEMKALFKNDPQALAGWKRAVADELIDRVTNTNTAISAGVDGPVSIAKLQTQFTKHEKALAQVFTPKEMQKLRQAHKMLEPMGNLSRQAVTGSPTVENEALWNSLEAGLLGVTGNAITTGMIMKRIRVALKFFPDQKKQAAHLAERAFFDPELMAHLLTKEAKAIRAPGWNAKLNRLLAVGEVARSTNKEDDETP